MVEKQYIIGKLSKWINLAIILSVVDSIQYNFGKKLLKWIDFWKKNQNRIDSVNSMFDHESLKVT